LRLSQCSRLYQSSIEAAVKVCDFDAHLEDTRNDWTNEGLALK
jgi:hypothetical protein